MKMMQAMTVRRSRLRSTTVEPAIDPPSCPPPNMSERPPPRPECNRIRKISSSATSTSMTTRIALSIARSLSGFGLLGRSQCTAGRAPTGTEPPDRLVGHHALRGVRGCHAVERGARLRGHQRVGISRVALGERLSHAHDRRHLVLQHRAQLQVHRLVGFAEELPPLGVADDDVSDVELREHHRADLARVRACILPVAVLRAELEREPIAVDERLQRAHVGERRAHDHVGGLVVGGVEAVRQLLHHLNRDEMVVVHLPVAGDDRPAACRIGHQPRGPFRNASRPGRSPSSMYSSAAPPPVLMWSMRSVMPRCRIAAALSPPPTTVKPRQSATASAMAAVPAANGATSNMPIGPFHSTDAAPAMRSAYSAAVSGPMSSPFQPSGIAPAGTMRVSASGDASRATTTSTGTCTRRVAMTSRHASTSSGSTSESPTRLPSATSNVKAIAPPTSTVSHRSSSDLITPSLSPTFTPPITATNGRLAPCNNCERTSISRTRRRPAACGRTRGGPTIEACARCDAPNASLTYASASADRFVSNAGSHLVSPGS